MPEYIRTPVVTHDGKLTRRRKQKGSLKRLNQIVPALRKLRG